MTRSRQQILERHHSTPPPARNLQLCLNTVRPRQNGRHFADDIFKCIFLNENAGISIMILLKFVPNGPINKIPALVQIMAWRRSGDKPLSQPMMVSLLTHMCVTRPERVEAFFEERPANFKYQRHVIVDISRAKMVTVG